MSSIIAVGIHGSTKRTTKQGCWKLGSTIRATVKAYYGRGSASNEAVGWLLEGCDIGGLGCCDLWFQGQLKDTQPDGDASNLIYASIRLEEQQHGQGSLPLSLAFKLQLLQREKYCAGPAERLMPLDREDAAQGI
jgi:hypothetical protein